MSWDRYLGKSGEMAVMSEFLAREYNVAIPQIDDGTDVIVIRREQGVWPVQVKSSTAKKRNQVYAAYVDVPRKQLVTLQTPDLFYVFAVREKETSKNAGNWLFFIGIGRKALSAKHEEDSVGRECDSSKYGKIVRFQIRWEKETAFLEIDGKDFSEYLNNFTIGPY
jgi:hypothetical protein